MFSLHIATYVKNSLKLESMYIFRQSKLFLTTNIYIVGKRNGGEEWINSGYVEYEKRLQSFMNIETYFLKSDEELLKISKTFRGSVLALDEKGAQYNSREFSKQIFNSFEEGGAHINFVIGGFSGLPCEIKQSYPLISLSKMTWTHQMARLLLIEQIYRAVEIKKGSNYHKD
eukprot:gene14111-18932_t